MMFCKQPQGENYFRRADSLLLEYEADKWSAPFAAVPEGEATLRKGDWKQGWAPEFE